jgi:C-terminal processing protease CtpA/Prc
MPDYVFEGKGMRIDGVTDGRPAFKAGLKTGDIVIKIGDTEVLDVQTYMQGLSKFKKGDSTTVKVKRGVEEIEAAVSFYITSVMDIFCCLKVTKSLRKINRMFVFRSFCCYSSYLSSQNT